MSLLDDLGSSVSTAWDDVTTAGVPAVIAGAEAYAAQQLTQASTSSAAQATAAAKQIVANTPPATGIMASINNIFSGIGLNLAGNAYGLPIVLGVGAIALYMLVL